MYIEQMMEMVDTSGDPNLRKTTELPPPLATSPFLLMAFDALSNARRNRLDALVGEGKVRVSCGGSVAELPRRDCVFAASLYEINGLNMSKTKSASQRYINCVFTMANDSCSLKTM